MFEFHYADGSVFKTHPECPVKVGHQGAKLVWHELTLGPGEHLVKVTQELDRNWDLNDGEHFGHKRRVLLETDSGNQLEVLGARDQMSKTRIEHIEAPGGQQIVRLERKGHWANPLH